jgi:hypothetical protein
MLPSSSVAIVFTIYSLIEAMDVVFIRAALRSLHGARLLDVNFNHTLQESWQFSKVVFAVQFRSASR